MRRGRAGDILAAMHRGRILTTEALSGIRDDMARAVMCVICSKPGIWATLWPSD